MYVQGQDQKTELKHRNGSVKVGEGANDMS